MVSTICYIPIYGPTSKPNMDWPRPLTRLSNQEIKSRIESGRGNEKPWMYLDAIDSILNIRPDIKLIVGDGRVSDSLRDIVKKHHLANGAAYDIMMYDEPQSQWKIFNDIIKTYCADDTKYFIYSSSDIIWHMDWVGEAIKAFEANPKLQILFPLVNRGDPNLPCQIANQPHDIDPILPPFQGAARAPVLNAYAMIFRMDFLRAYGGYPNVFRNCFTESFLAYMCDAVGGEMRLLPRGHVHHYGEGDKWTTPGSAYYYTEERLLFQDVMNKVLMHKAMGRMNVEFLKKTLYK